MKSKTLHPLFTFSQKPAWTLVLGFLICTQAYSAESLSIRPQETPDTCNADLAQVRVTVHGIEPRGILNVELELSRVKRELAEVKMERDFIKKVCDVFRQGVAVRYDLIESMRQSYPIVFMCQLLDVSESGFHARNSRPLSKCNRENARLEIEILAAHHRTRETYSAKRLYHDLADHGVQTTPYRVRTLRKK